MLSLRGQNSAYVNNSSSGTVALPAGCVAGDNVVVFATQAWQVNTPAGYGLISNNNQANYNYGVFTKTLTSADITTGTVTVTFTGTFYGHIAIVAFVGTTNFNLRTKAFLFSPGGAATRTLATNSLPLTNDYVLYFGAGRVNTAITSSLGGALLTDSQANSSFVLTGGNLAADGAISDTFSYPTVPGGDVQIVLVYTDSALPTYAQIADMQAEVLHSANPKAQVVDMQAEVLHDAVAKAQVVDMSVEVLRSVVSVSRRRPTFLIMNGPS